LFSFENSRTLTVKVSPTTIIEPSSFSVCLFGAKASTSFDKGAVIALSEDVEAFAPKRHTEKEDGSSIAVGETLSFRILEFSKDNKKILVSHTAIFKEELEAERKKSAASAKKVMKKLEDDKQQSTLGDLDSLAALKNDLENGKK
jgi:small subunit ribosomal protein S1